MKLLPQGDLRAGDVLLCLPDGFFDVIRRAITWKTKSRYTHAAICLGNNVVLEAVRPLIRKLGIDALLNRYAHVAVFRQPDAWDMDRQAALTLFASMSVIGKARYNLTGAIRSPALQTANSATINERLDAYFKNPIALEPNSKKQKYFCSEIVVDSYIATGFIDPSAAVIYQANAYTPVALSEDATFGTFLGYISSRRSYTVPCSDEFYRLATYGDIFGGNAK